MKGRFVVIARLLALLMIFCISPLYAQAPLSKEGQQFEDAIAKQMRGDIRVAYMISLCGYRSDDWLKTFTDNYILTVTSAGSLSPRDKKFLLSEGAKTVKAQNLASCPSYLKASPTYDRLRYDIENGTAYNGSSE